MTAQPLEIRMARLEGAYQQLDTRLGDLARTIGSHFAQVDSRFGQIDSRFSQADTNFQKLNQKVDTILWRLTSLVLVTWITTILAVLLHHS